MGETPIPQYSLVRTLLIWAAAAGPMAALGWVVAPVLAHGGSPGFERQAVLGAGLAWQCLLVLILVRLEAGRLSWAVLRDRLWLRGPSDPATGVRRARTWFWLLPIIVLTAVFQLFLRAPVDHLFTTVFPALSQPRGWDFGGMLATPQGRAALAGRWDILALFITTALFNTVVGEELLFRGLLLPRMSGVFGRWDWLANGMLFGLYHLHQPWGMPGSVITGVLCYALPSRVFRSSWFGIAAHSGQSVYLTILILGLVLGFGPPGG